jgi:hypothetical protein
MSIKIEGFATLLGCREILNPCGFYFPEVENEAYNGMIIFGIYRNLLASKCRESVCEII